MKPLWSEWKNTASLNLRFVGYSLLKQCASLYFLGSRYRHEAELSLFVVWGLRLDWICPLSHWLGGQNSVSRRPRPLRSSEIQGRLVVIDADLLSVIIFLTKLALEEEFKGLDARL